MRYVALRDDQERHVDIERTAAGLYRLQIDNRVLNVSAEPLPDGRLSMVVSGRSVVVDFDEATAGGCEVLLDGQAVNLEVLDLRKLRARKAQALSGSHDGVVEIRSPMPGKVVAVLAQEGQEVQEGEGLVVVEAMKMENELKSPKAGTVTGIRVEAGLAVEGGAILCAVE